MLLLAFRRTSVLRSAAKRGSALLKMQKLFDVLILKQNFPHNQFDATIFSTITGEKCCSRDNGLVVRRRSRKGISTILCNANQAVVRSFPEPESAVQDGFQEKWTAQVKFSAVKVRQTVARSISVLLQSLKMRLKCWMSVLHQLLLSLLSVIYDLRTEPYLFLLMVHQLEISVRSEIF